MMMAAETRRMILNKPQVSFTSLPELVAARANQSEVERVYADIGVVDADTVNQIQQLRVERGLSIVEAARALECIDETDLRQALGAKFGLQPQEIGQGTALSDELFAVYEPHHSYIAALRVVREELVTRWFAKPRNSLIVAGTEMGVGASRVAANLAVLFALRGNRVLLIDADFSNQRQKEIFSIRSREGLTDCLAGWIDLNEAATRISQVPGLSVLTVGTPPPAQCEILSRREFRDLVLKAEESFDIVLVDIAPSLYNSDTVSASICIGGALLVMRKNHTRLDAARELSTQIKSVGGQVVGAVLNEF